jgi:DNA polymerase-1
MAPYYLGVDPFWENPASHDDPLYNEKDCRYTYLLHEKLLGMSEQDGTLEFYQSKLLPWTKLLAEAEYEGVLVDETKLQNLYQETINQAKLLEAKVHEFGKEAFKTYRQGLVDELSKDAHERCASYISKRLKDTSKAGAVRTRYAESLREKLSDLPSHFNLNSPEQMKVLLGYYGVDMDVEKRDKETNEWIEKEGTDKFVLIRSKVRQKLPIAEALLRYRQKQTEVSYLKQYIAACVQGRIHTTFNATGTRTGRLSSAGPNLQNVKGGLRLPFLVGRPEKYSIYTVDSSQIEPRLVAHYTGDAELVKLFQDGRDYHNFATKKFFPKETQGVPESDVKNSHGHLRKTAKLGDLSIIYGTGYYTFQTMCLVREEMDIPLDRCKDMVLSFREGMKDTFAWKQGLEESYNSGHIIHTFMGRLVQARDSSSVHMTLFNTLVQGTASDVILHASLLAYRRFCQLGVDAKPLLWVHDEVVWRFPKGKEKFCKETVDYYMKAYKLDTPHGRVPLDVDGHLASCWEK